jgi:hypothetical protein
MGTYTHIAASMHVYEEEAATCKAILTAAESSSSAMPVMMTAGYNVANALIEHERRLRLLPRTEFKSEPFLDDYWRRFMRPIAAAHDGIEVAKAPFID